MKSYFANRGIGLIVALGFWCAHANIASAAQPIAPAVAGSDYSVTYNNDYTVRSYTRGLPIFPSIGVEWIP